ncbi:MAG: hypothetical protein REI11_17655 [Patulibacter sp.]|nr:hypothetical protein [Patulibacter sp.]
MASPRLLLSTALVAAAAGTGPAAAPAAARSALSAARTSVAAAYDSSCSSENTTQPFAAWADRADYVAAPGGSFEPADTRWSLLGGATIADDNEPWHVSGDDTDASSLALRPGASANSPSFCGGADHPTLRLFARSANGSPATALLTVRYTGPGDHLLAALPLGVITAGKSWAPTSTTLTLSGLRLVTGTKLGITLTSLTGTVLFDDVYVDPYRRS